MAYQDEKEMQWGGFRPASSLDVYQMPVTDVPMDPRTTQTGFFGNLLSGLSKAIPASQQTQSLLGQIGPQPKPQTKKAAKAGKVPQAAQYGEGGDMNAREVYKGANLGDTGLGLLAFNRGKVGLKSIYESPSLMESIYSQNVGRVATEQQQEANRLANLQAAEVAKQQAEAAKQAGLKTSGLTGISQFGAGESAVPGAGAQPMIDPETGEPMIDPQTGEVMMQEAPQVDQRQAMMSNLLLMGYKPREAAQMAQAQTALDPTMTDTDIIRAAAGAGQPIKQGESVSLEGQKAIQEDLQQQETELADAVNATKLQAQRLANAGQLAAAMEATNRALMLEDKKAAIAQQQAQLAIEQGLPIGVGGEEAMKELMKGRAKQLVESEAAYTAAQQNADTTLNQMDQVENILQKVDTGKWEDVGDQLSDLTGINVTSSDARAQRKQLKSIMTQQVLAQAEALAGPKSDSDIALLERAAAGGAVTDDEYLAAVKRIKGDIKDQLRIKKAALGQAQQRLGMGGAGQNFREEVVTGQVDTGGGQESAVIDASEYFS